jgi:hypothetical protein
MTQLTDKQAFKDAFRRRIRRYHVEALDADVFLRPLSSASRARLADAHNALQANADSTVYDQAKRIQWGSVAAALVTESGEPIYGGDEVDQVGEDIDGQALDEISVEILRISGLGKTAETVSEIAKNLEPAQTSDSPSSSAGRLN